MLAYVFHWPPGELMSLELDELAAWLHEAEAIQGQIADAAKGKK